MSLSEIAIKKQAEGLVRNLKVTCNVISDRYNVFRELCRAFNQERGYSSTTAKEIKERYKEVNTKFVEARSLYQLLRKKYRGYVQLDSQTLRELEDLALMYKKDYRYFEQNHSEYEQRTRGKKEVPLRILSQLHDIYVERPSLPSLILCFHGDPASLETLKTRIRLGSGDMCEEKEGELWFLLTGIRPSRDGILQHKLLENLFQGLSTIRGVVLKVSKEEDAREEVLRDMLHTIGEVQQGEIKIL